MKRRHSREMAIKFCKKFYLLEKKQHLVDIIAGFPTETEEMFLDSIRLVDECQLTHFACISLLPERFNSSFKNASGR